MVVTSEEILNQLEHGELMSDKSVKLVLGVKTLSPSVKEDSIILANCLVGHNLFGNV